MVDSQDHSEASVEHFFGTYRVRVRVFDLIPYFVVASSVRIVRGGPGGVVKLIKPVSSIIVHHLLIVAKTKYSVQIRKLFVG